jgi:ABC-type transporter MlaC component
MQIIEEILDELVGTQFFTKLDMTAGYHQIRMQQEDEYKTTFKTHKAISCSG